MSGCGQVPYPVDFGIGVLTVFSAEDASLPQVCDSLSRVTLGQGAFVRERRMRGAAGADRRGLPRTARYPHDHGVNLLRVLFFGGRKEGRRSHVS